jgi:hypothetical protein
LAESRQLCHRNSAMLCKQRSCSELNDRSIMPSLTPHYRPPAPVRARLSTRADHHKRLSVFLSCLAPFFFGAKAASAPCQAFTPNLVMHFARLRNTEISKSGFAIFVRVRIIEDASDP